MKIVKQDQLHTVFYKNRSAEEILAEIIGERYIKYRKKWDRSEKGELVQDYPLHLNCELFYGCNLRCPMCVISSPLKERSYKVDAAKKISFEKYREIIDEGAKRGLCAVQLNGFNEPLLLKDLEKYIRYAKDAGIVDIFIVTNATILTPARSRSLIESGLTQIKFSLDAIREETYGKIRVGGDFKRTMDNVRRFIKIKKEMKSVLPITRVSMVKTKENSGEIDEFINYWTGKIDYVAIQNMSNPFVDNGRQSKLDRKLGIDNVDFSRCLMPFQRLYIRNNGDVTPCCSSYGREITVGNIYKNTIYEIWNGEPMKRIRETINKISVEPRACRRCKLSFLHKEKG